MSHGDLRYSLMATTAGRELHNHTRKLQPRPDERKSFMSADRLEQQLRYSAVRTTITLPLQFTRNGS